MNEVIDQEKIDEAIAAVDLEQHQNDVDELKEIVKACNAILERHATEHEFVDRIEDALINGRFERRYSSIKMQNAIVLVDDEGKEIFLR